MKDINKEKFYSEIFSKTAAALRSGLFKEQDIIIETGIWLDSVVIKLYKEKWTDKQTGSSVFFSVWIEDKSLNRNQIFYNIHALKLRLMRGYKIESIKFAVEFRNMFREYEYLWPNVSMNYGPATLMQGYINLDDKCIEKDVSDLLLRFLKIEFIIDEVLDKWKR